ncbi:MAG TPA: hypothetical protein VIK18_24240 [Pirellulales bacterium]
MHQISLQEAQSQLADLVHGLVPGDELIITANGQPVALLVSQPGGAKRQPRRPGTLKGTVLYMAPDFDAPLNT